MTLPLRIPALLSALTLMALGGCSGRPAPTTSTLTGTIAQPSFVSPVTKITVTNDKGQSAVAAVGAHGEFSIKLKKGATYQLFLSDDGKSTPIILNSDPWPTTTVHVKSGGASVNIGSVRFWPGDLSDRRRLIIPDCVTAVQECVNGVIAGSNKPCASGAAALQCADDDDDDDDVEHEDDNDVEHADESAAQANVEHVDSQSQATAADVKQAMGIPEHNIVGDVGCDDDDDDDDDEEEDD